MGSKVQARVSHPFKTSAERVYDAWLDPGQVRQWMAASLISFGLAGDMRRIEIDPRIGGKFFFSDLRDGQEAQHWGTYRALDRPSKIEFSWIVVASDEADPSIVTLSIQSESEGCVATLVHEMDAAWADYVERTERGWAKMLDSIDELLA